MSETDAEKGQTEVVDNDAPRPKRCGGWKRYKRLGITDRVAVLTSLIVLAIAGHTVFVNVRFWVHSGMNSVIPIESMNDVELRNYIAANVHRFSTNQLQQVARSIQSIKSGNTSKGVRKELLDEPLHVYPVVGLEKTWKEALTDAVNKINAGEKTIILESSDINDDDAIWLAETLKADNSVESIWLNDNKIGADGAQALAKMLEVNKHLKTLGLRGNHIGNEGAKAFAKSLKQNDGLEVLFIGANGVTDNGAVDLAAMLAVNYHLQTLGLLDNGETTYGIHQIEIAVNNRGVPLRVLHNEDQSHLKQDDETQGNYRREETTAQRA